MDTINNSKLNELKNGNKKIKVAHISDTYYPRTNGVAVYVDSCTNYMINKGFDVIILAAQYPIEDKRPERPNVKIKRFRAYRLFFTTNKDERTIYFSEKKNIYKFLDEENPDIVYVQTEFLLGIYALKWAKKNNKLIIMIAHTYWAPYIKYYAPYLPLSFCHFLVNHYLNWYFSAADILITSTQEMEDFLVKECKIKNPIHRMFIGIDETDFQNFDKEKEKAEMLEVYPKLKDKKVLLFVGRICKEKNVDFLLKAMKKILEYRKDVELLLVGGGHYMQYYMDMAKSLGISEYTTFCDAVEHAKIRKYYALSDLFVFPSVTETQGLVTTESLYLGIPVVAVSALGTKTVLKGNKGGFLVDENDVEFAEKVNLLLDNKEIYEQKKEEALERGKSLSFSANYTLFS